MIESEYDYAAIKQVTIEEFSEIVSPQDSIRGAMHCKFRPVDMATSLTDMYVCFKKANFNDEAQFGVLRNAVMDHMDLAQYVLLRDASGYETL